MRLFIAALLPQEIHKLLSSYTNTLKKNIHGVKWEKSEKLHITLKFLGSVDDDQVSQITHTTSQLTSKYAPFKISLTQFGAFPSLNNPRVLYAGLTSNNLLSKFQSVLETRLCDLGFEKDNRKFTPHVTLARVKKRLDLRAIPRIREKTFHITQIALIKSELRPEGSVYTPVKIYKLEK